MTSTSVRSEEGAVENLSAATVGLDESRIRIPHALDDDDHDPFADLEADLQGRDRVPGNSNIRSKPEMLPTSSPTPHAGDLNARTTVTRDETSLETPGHWSAGGTLARPGHRNAIPIESQAESSPATSITLDNQLSGWIALLEVAERQQTALSRRQKARDWTEWCSNAFDSGGGGAAHAFTRIKPTYEEEVYVRKDGTVTASLDGILEQQMAQWQQAWQAGTVQDQFVEAPAVIPPRCSPELLKRISRRFKTRTIAVDGIHPKHFSLLSDHCLSALTGIFSIMNMISNAPSNLQQ
eukprot:6084590-Pyramimonas_sp.AAC.1